MNFTQAIAFNSSIAGTIPNLCLDNVRRGFGIENKYGSAWIAWQHTQQHPDQNIPDGLDVPLYYSYTTTIAGETQNFGHINVRLKNGTVWSDGNIYASIEDYTSKKLPKFVGWGESINDFKIIQGVIAMTDKNQIRDFAWAFFGRNARQTEIDTYSQLPLQETINRILTSPEYLAYHENRDKVVNATVLAKGKYQVL